MLPLPEYLTVSESAKIVGVTTQAVYARIDNGWLATQRVYGRIVVARAGVEKWCAERAEKHLTLSTGGV